MMMVSTERMDMMMSAVMQCRGGLFVMSVDIVYHLQCELYQL